MFAAKRLSMFVALQLAVAFFSRPPSLEERCAALGTFDGPVEGDVCRLSWHDAQPHMRPTQPGIGYNYAMIKLIKDMDAYKPTAEAQASAQETMDEKGIPAVKYGAKYYFTDGHHTQSALDALHGIHPGIEVHITVTIICDLSHLDEPTFWSTMVERGWAYLWDRPPGQPNALPTPFPPADLPTTISWRTADTATLSNDVWRSWAGYARQVEKDYVTDWWPEGLDCEANAAAPFDGATQYEAAYVGCDIAAAVGPKPDPKHCMRTFDRHCHVDTCNTIPFFEYYWAYFFNDAYNDGNGLLSTFAEIYDEPLVEFTDEAPYYAMPDPETATAETANLPNLTPWACCRPRTEGQTGVDERCHRAKDGYKQWTHVASELVPLARSAFAQAYRLPDDFLVESELPGYVGAKPIYHKDPSCTTAAHQCGEAG